MLLTGCANRLTVASTSTSANSSIAFVGVTVVPLVGTDVQLPNQTVVVNDARIAAIGPGSATRIPTGTRRIDATGKYLIPGLADMHVHPEYTEDPAILAMFLANGVTTVRSMDGRPYILE